MRDNLDDSLYPLIAAIIVQAAEDYLEVSNDSEYLRDRRLYQYTAKRFLEYAGMADKADMLVRDQSSKYNHGMS
jgi:hypothetical protein